MTRAVVMDRLETERRLLAALYLWPRHVDLEPSHFMAPMHGALFETLDAIGSSVALDQRLHAIHAWLSAGHRLGVFGSVGGVRQYISSVLVPIGVREREIPELVEAVRVCPRCGR